MLFRVRGSGSFDRPPHGITALYALWPESSCRQDLRLLDHAPPRVDRHAEWWDGLRGHPERKFSLMDDAAAIGNLKLPRDVLEDMHVLRGWATVVPLDLQELIVITHDPVIRYRARLLQSKMLSNSCPRGTATLEELVGAAAWERSIVLAPVPRVEKDTRRVDVANALALQPFHEPVLASAVVALDAPIRLRRARRV